MTTQNPDPRPGFYYVTVRRTGPRGAVEYRPLRGPYDTHAEALAAVTAARIEACDRDPRATWYEFGTCRSEDDLGPGILDRTPMEKHHHAPPPAYVYDSRQEKST